MWDIVQNGNYISLDEKGEKLSKNEWTDDQKQTYLLNSKAQKSLMCVLSKEQYGKVHTYKGAKEMWETLVITYEGFA